jgi:hypothetical protein
MPLHAIPFDALAFPRPNWAGAEWPGAPKACP